MGHQANKRRSAVVGAKQFHKLRFGYRSGRRRVDRREDAAVHWYEMRRENDFDGFARQVAEHLLDLRRVAMFADAVGRHAFVALGKMVMQLGRAASDGDATLAFDDD